MKENFAETMRQLSAAWRNMSEQEKDRYRDVAAQQAAPGRSSKTGKMAGGSARQRSRTSGSRQRQSTSVSLDIVLLSLSPSHQPEGRYS